MFLAMFALRKALKKRNLGMLRLFNLYIKEFKEVK